MRKQSTHQTDTLLTNLSLLRSNESVAVVSANATKATHSITVREDRQILAQSTRRNDDTVKLLVEFVAERDVGTNGSS
jgi:hypothetical protein